jgi:hypothetical protein
MTGDFGFPSEPDTGEGEERVQARATDDNKRKFDRNYRKKVFERAVIENQGRIARLFLPARFALSVHRETDYFTVFEYEVPDIDSMRIAHWDWSSVNSRLPDEVGASFLSVLAKPAHVLSEEEVEHLEEVIPQEVYGYSGAFDVVKLRTERFGGENVLIFENRWWDADRKAFGLFFPSYSALESGCHLESIHFEGNDYYWRKAFLSAKACFMSIKWRSQS